jgi:hypothetical protein
MQHITLGIDRKLSEVYAAVKQVGTDPKTVVDLEIAGNLNRRMRDIL